MTTMPDSVALALPDDWLDIPLGEAEHRAFVDNQLRSLMEAGVVDRGQLRQFELVAAVAHQLAQRSRVMIASSYFEVDVAVDDDDEDLILTANLVVSAFLREELDTDVPLRAEILAESYSRRVPSDDENARYDFIEPPSVCEIGGYKAAKLLRLMSLPPERGADIKQFIQTYLVSVAEGDAVIVLQFSTMNYELAREFSELFEAIAQTIRVLYPGDPTFLDDIGPVEAGQDVDPVAGVAAAGDAEVAAPDGGEAGT